MAMRIEARNVVTKAVAFSKATNELAVTLIALFGIWNRLSDTDYTAEKAEFRAELAKAYAKKGRKESAAKSMADNICAMGNNWRKLSEPDHRIISAWTLKGGSSTANGKRQEWEPFGYDTLKRTISSRLAEVIDDPKAAFVNPYFRKAGAVTGARGGNTANNKVKTDTKTDTKTDLVTADNVLKMPKPSFLRAATLALEVIITGMARHGASGKMLDALRHVESALALIQSERAAASGK